MNREQSETMGDKRILKKSEKLWLWVSGFLILATALGGYYFMLNSHPESVFANKNRTTRNQEESANANAEMNDGNQRNTPSSSGSASISSRDRHKGNKSKIPAQAVSTSGQEKKEGTESRNREQNKQSGENGSAGEKSGNGNKQEEDKKSESNEGQKEYTRYHGKPLGLVQKTHENLASRKGIISENKLTVDGTPLVKKSKIKVYREAKTIILPAQMVQHDTWLEVFLCSEGGKSHESLFVTEVSPKKFKLSLIISDFMHEENRREQGPRYLGDPRMPGGDHVKVSVEWQLKTGNWIRYRGEDLIRNMPEQQTMRKFGWVFAGSYFKRELGPGRGKSEIFAASRVKTLIALFHDPAAILDIPVPQGGADIVYKPRKKILPPSGTNVRLILQRPTEKELKEMEDNIKESKRVWEIVKQGNSGPGIKKRGSGSSDEKKEDDFETQKDSNNSGEDKQQSKD